MKNSLKTQVTQLCLYYSKIIFVHLFICRVFESKIYLFLLFTRNYKTRDVVLLHKAR